MYLALHFSLHLVSKMSRCYSVFEIRMPILSAKGGFGGLSTINIYKKYKFYKSYFFLRVSTLNPQNPQSAIYDENTPSNTCQNRVIDH